MEFELKIESGNAAFDDGNARDEVARILREIATALEGGREGGHARDINGNRVGDWSLEIDEPEESADDES